MNSTRRKRLPGSTTGGTAPPTNTVAPAVTGSLTQGSTLTTTNGTWTGSPTFTYQWHNSATGPITGATSSTYASQASDVSDNIYCIVTGANAGGATGAKSNTVGPITASSGYTPALKFNDKRNSMYL